MKIQTEIKKWGNSLGLRVTGTMKDIPEFKEGTKVDVTVTKMGLNIVKAEKPKGVKLPFSEKQLLKDMTPLTAHADIIATPFGNELKD